VAQAGKELVDEKAATRKLFRLSEGMTSRDLFLWNRISHFRGRSRSSHRSEEVSSQVAFLLRVISPQASEFLHNLIAFPKMEDTDESFQRDVRGMCTLVANPADLPTNSHPFSADFYLFQILTFCETAKC
jgi:hypothetical protein